jgi:RNA polymerase sigma-70 factor (ECF subfamily)
VLDPDVVLVASTGPSPGGWRRIRGAARVAQAALTFAFRVRHARPALVNGAAGLVVADDDHSYAIMAFTVVQDRIAELDILADPARLA